MNGRTRIDVDEIKKLFLFVDSSPIPGEDHFKAELFEAMKADKVLVLLKVVILRLHNVLRNRVAGLMDEFKADCADIFALDGGV